MIIRAIVIDGFHKGHVVTMRYHPTVRLLRPKVIKVDYCCDESRIPEHTSVDYMEYKECFRAVDQKTVLYSITGDSAELMATIPEKVFSTQGPWNEFTTLYVGFHGEPIIREDERPTSTP